MKGILFFLLVGLTLTYNADAAIKYAREYCKRYNYKYYNYRNQGGDCANFVSQCLIAGGESLSGCTGLDKRGAIPGVTNLENCLISKGWSFSVGINGHFKQGFPFFYHGEHAMIATAVNGHYLKYCGHTNDRCDENLEASNSYYYYYK